MPSHILRRPLFAKVLALIVMGTGSAMAQSGGAYSFVRYGVEHGLPSERITSVAQDSSGFIWVGTADGIARFDGVRARVWRHQPRSTTGLPSIAINSITVSASGTVWVGTSAGLARFDEEAGRFVRFAEEEIQRYGGGVGDLIADEEGLWASMPNGVVRVRFDGTADWFEVIGGPQIRSPQGSGEAWLYHERCQLWDNPVRCVAPRSGPAPNLALLASWTQDGATLGVFVKGSVWRLRPSPALVDEWVEFDALPQPTTAVVDLPRIWFATASGPFVYDIEQEQLLRLGIGNGVLSRDARDVLVDRQGGVWLATDRGLYRGIQPDPAFRAVTIASGLPDGRVNGLLTTPDGSTWIGTNGGLYQRSADGTWGSFFTGKNVYANGVWQVVRASGGGLWVGGKGFGLRRLWPETGRWEQVGEIGRLLGLGNTANGRLAIRHVLDESNRLWISSTTGLGVRLEDGTWLTYQQGDGGRDRLPASATNIVHVDGGGRIWVGTDAGLVEFDVRRRSFRRVAPTSLGASIVWDIAETPDDPGALWLATVGTGMCRLDPEADQVECFTIADGLPSNVVHRLEPSRDAMWLGTDRGVARFDLEARTVATFTQADGLHGNIADFMSSYRATDGTLLFGGPGGYTVFDPEAVTERGAPPVVRFTAVTAGSALLPPVLSGDTIRLARGERQFTAEFAALDFTAPAQNRYRYRLLPLEDEWTRVNARAAEARYNALPPGEYVLEVLGSSHTGTFGEIPAQLRISVPPSWWERASVRLLGLVLTIGAIGAVGWRAVRKSEQERTEAAEVAQQLAAARENERIRLARELHDGAMQHIYRAGHDLDRLAQTAGLEAVSVAREGLDEAAGDLRAVLTDIRPPHVGTLGAAAAVRAAATQFGRTYPDTVLDLDLEATGRRWPVPVQHAIVRIAQEALSNAGRHAQASRITIILTEANGHAALEVADDGVGFDDHMRDVDHVRGGHFGLAGLRERAEALGGTVKIESSPGNGARVGARLPLEPAKGRRWLGLMG